MGEKGLRRNRGRLRGEERYFLDVQSRAVPLTVSIRAELEMAAAASLILQVFVSGTDENSLVYHPRGAVACTDDAQTGASPHSHTHIPLGCCIGVTYTHSKSSA